MNDYRELLSTKNESWKNAINRYILFTETDMKDYFDIGNSYYFKSNPMYAYNGGDPFSLEYLQRFEKEHKFHIPPDLTELLSVHGNFTIGNSIFEIFSEQKGLIPLASALDIYNFGNIAEGISPSMLESLDQYYYFFGVSFPQSDEVSFLFIDRGTHFGKMHIHVKNIDLTLKKTLPDMFKGKNDFLSLDNLIANQIDRVIINALIVKGFIEIDNSAS